MNTVLVSQLSPVIERLDSPVLEVGQYWRDRAIFGPLGVRLVTDLKYVHGEAHTVTINAHPSSGDCPRMFFIKDFFADFVFEPNGEQIRQEEVAAIQEEIARLQNELLELNCNPAKLEELAQATVQTTTNTQPVLISLSDITFPDLKKVNEQSVALMRASLDATADLNREKAQILMEKATAISKIVKKTLPFYEELSVRIFVQTLETSNYTEKLLDGVASLDIYLGKNVQIEQIQSGASADYTEPLTILQKKLAMDEELCLFEDVNEYLDASDETLFVQRLQTYPAFVEQIFTRPRAVVLMALTRRTLEYSENQFENDAKNQKNKSVFLLIRNGENIFRVWSPVFSHLQAQRLFPSPKEQESFFQTKKFSFNEGVYSQETETVKYENAFFSKCMEWHDEAALHYKRFILLLAGLDLQKQLFGTFHPAEVNFISIDFQNKYMRFLFDDEGGNSLLENAYTESLEDFFHRHNKQILTGKNGSRIFCDLSQMVSRGTTPGAFTGKGYFDSFEQVQNAFPFQNFDIFTVKELNGKSYIDVPMTKMQQKNGETKTKIINCKVFLEPKYFDERNKEISAFLHFDGIELEELRCHLNNRGLRFSFLSYVRLFKHVEKELEKRDACFEKVYGLLQTMRKGNSREMCKKLFIAWLIDRQFVTIDEKEKLECVSQIAEQLSLIEEKESLKGKVLFTIAKRSGQNGKNLNLNALSLAGDGTVIAYTNISEDEKDNRFEDDPRMMRYILKVEKRSLSIFHKAQVFSPFLNLREVFIENEQPILSFMDLCAKTETSFYTPESIRNGTFKVKTQLFDNPLADFSNSDVRNAFLDKIIQQQKESSEKDVVSMTAYWPMYFYNKKRFDENGQNSQQGEVLCLTLHDVIHGLCLMEKNGERREGMQKKYIALFADKIAAKRFLNQQFKQFKEKKSFFVFESIPVWMMRQYLEDKKKSFCYDEGNLPLLSFTRGIFMKGEPFPDSDENLSLYMQMEKIKQSEEANGAVFSKELSSSSLVKFLGMLEKLL